MVIVIVGLPEEEYFASGHRACAGCGEALAVRTALKAAGKNTIVVSATGCMEVVSSPYPQTAWKVPWIHVAFENAAAVAAGVDAGLKAMGKREGINILAIAGDGGTFDIGLQALSGAVERGHRFTYLCTENEAYMNTGAQRSGATPLYSATTTTPAGKAVKGKQDAKKPMPLIMAAHGMRYVATASVSEPLDFFSKMKKALSAEGPSYVQVLAPCPPGWYHDSRDTIRVARLAVHSGVQPLYEIDGGELKFSHRYEERKAVENYLKMQGRFKHLKPEDIAQVQKYVDERYNFLLELEKKGKVFDVLL